ncbi:MAG: RNA polymerase sigma factor [Acidimicrobiales bacterium]
MDESHAVDSVGAEVSLDGLLGLYHDQVGEVYAFVLRRCGADVGLAEDITQDTFLAAARQFRTTGAVPPRAWLYQTARNRLIDHWRREARKERKLRLVGSRDRDLSIGDPAEAVVSGDQVLESLARLPAAQQAALVLRYLDGCSTREVAEMLGRSLKATESVLARARRNLEANYQEQGCD